MTTAATAIALGDITNARPLANHAEAPFQSKDIHAFALATRIFGWQMRNFRLPQDCLTHPKKT